MTQITHLVVVQTSLICDITRAARGFKMWKATADKLDLGNFVKLFFFFNVYVNI